MEDSIDVQARETAQILIDEWWLHARQHPDNAMTLEGVQRIVASGIRKAVKAITEAESDECEHGVTDGDWCDKCHKAYKDATKENDP